MVLQIVLILAGRADIVCRAIGDRVTASPNPAGLASISERLAGEERLSGVVP
jgi:hypothetical protein